jgi:hypothetical protein
MKKALKTLDRGAAFAYAGQRWIALEHDPEGRTLCLAEDITELRAFDEGNCNDWSKSTSRTYLNGPYLDTLIDKAGSSEAFDEVDVDLTTDDGLKDYGTCKAIIFLLNVDQYRRNRDVIPNASDWWWLGTAFSTAANGYEHSARLVYSDGSLNNHLACYGSHGLRPACYLDSDLLISIEEADVDAETAGEIVRDLIEGFGSSFATEEQFKAAAAFMLGTLRAAREQEVAHE